MSYLNTLLGRLGKALGINPAPAKTGPASPPDVAATEPSSDHTPAE